MKRHLCIFTIILILIFLGLHHFGVALFDYDGKQEEKFKATIISNGEKKEYTTSYQILIDGKKFICHVKNKKQENITGLKIGNIIEFEGKYNKPDSARNEGGFDYNLYLKSKKIYRSFQIDSYKIADEDKSLNVKIIKLFSVIREKVKECYQKNLIIVQKEKI